MQRDMDLIRLILLELEKAPGAFTGEMKFDGYSPEQVSYHCWLLLEGGFALGVETTHQGSIGREAVATTLTWEGHEFLDAARDPGIWRRATERLSTVGGSVALSVLQSVLNDVATKSLGLS